MNSINYVLFEIIKYKIEFNEFLEYSLPTYEIETNDMKNKYNSLKSTYADGVYKDIITSLFNDYEAVNKPLKTFLSEYNDKKILKMIKKKKLNQLVTYNQRLIDCYETFNIIINNFFNEKEILKSTDKRISKLNSTSNDQFNSFLFFNAYHTYIDCVLNNKSSIKFEENELKELVGIINYCNKDNKYQNYIDILSSDNEQELNKKIEQLSNKCIELDQKQNKELNELIDSLNKELEKDKK